MTRRYNTKHTERGRSRYPLRLQARGLTKAPPLAPLSGLQARQEARVKNTGHPWKLFRIEERDEAA
jgi:hypothetical protein